MLPHSSGIDSSIAEAFRECALAFHRLEERELDDNARSWVTKIKHLMDTSAIFDASGEGTGRIKARSLSEDQQLELSSTVDELADWFNRKFEED
jgi:hypothetical protein